jgi:sugar/nucleoside kinase (ribokinase family)
MVIGKISPPISRSASASSSSPSDAQITQSQTAPTVAGKALAEDEDTIRNEEETLQHETTTLEGHGKRATDVLSVLTGKASEVTNVEAHMEKVSKIGAIAVHVASAVAADVKGVLALFQQKASEVTNVEAHLENFSKIGAIVVHVGSAVADDAKQGAEAGLNKGLDAAKNAADVQAHLEKAQQAAVVATNIASAAAEDAKKGAEAGLNKGLDAAKNAADVQAHLGKAQQAAAVATGIAPAAAEDAERGSHSASPGQLLHALMLMKDAPLPETVALPAYNARQETGVGPRVHVIGNSVVDILVKGAGTKKEEKEKKALAADSFSSDNVQVISAPITPALGGSGAASAYVLSRLGARVWLHSNIAEDAFGCLLRGWLKEAGVTLLHSSASATAAHVICIQGDKRNSSYYRGDKVDWTALTQAPDLVEGDWCLAAGYGAVDGKDLGELTYLAKHLKALGCKLAFDPSPWFANRVQRGEMLELWTHLELLTGTADELMHWLGAKSFLGAFQREKKDRHSIMPARAPSRASSEESAGIAGKSITDKEVDEETKVKEVKTNEKRAKSSKADVAAEDLAKECLRLCPVARLVVVKRGALGASWAAPLSGNEGVPRDKNDHDAIIETGSFRAEVCEAANSVGAGDTFNAQLIYGLATGLTPASAISLGLCLCLCMCVRERDREIVCVCVCVCVCV